MRQTIFAAAACAVFSTFSVNAAAQAPSDSQSGGDLCTPDLNMCLVTAAESEAGRAECLAQLADCQGTVATPSSALPQEDACERACTATHGLWGHTDNHPDACMCSGQYRLDRNDSCRCVRRPPRAHARPVQQPPPAEQTPAPATSEAEDREPAGAANMRPQDFCTHRCRRHGPGPEQDDDCDGVLNKDDNCRSVCNPLQTDLDHDGRGAACDDDPVEITAAEFDELTLIVARLGDRVPPNLRSRLNALDSRIRGLPEHVANADEVNASLEEIRAELEELRNRYFSRVTFGGNLAILPGHPVGLGMITLRLFQKSRLGISVSGGLGTDGHDFAVAGAAHVLYLSNDQSDDLNWSLGPGVFVASVSDSPFDGATYGLVGGELAADLSVLTGDHDPMLTFFASFGFGDFGDRDRDRSTLYGRLGIGITVW